MAKQLNVNLNFTANASQAQQVLNNLQSDLNKIASITPINGTKLSADLQQAKMAAKDLQQHLLNAFNVNTGNLDLGKLEASLKSSGQSLGSLSANLLKAGTTGQEAFLNIQRSISNASVQINQANGLLTQFWTTLKNTARWQISSGILHGLMSGLQSAWGYAKELDKSLNNIRIVTGYSTERMAEFAEQANKAAKALNTTTTDYTNASLIYYQQGLSDQEIAERTEITIKMANATGESAQQVSDQLTAIWNNFDDGSKSLEYYVDVITALGAATASSTDEISQGLEKFAAVAETVGLSYEYATAALATVTAETRQSADVVGTAFKTLFARIQGLKLGETLDDGTTLNSYSEALMKVGINIKDSNGELKEMDTILSEMGSKWDTLSKAQQVALAQTVGGIRQYNQLISLMDNWDVFENNLVTIKNSSGTLTEQANIYADSWEAATNRVQAAAEGIYRDLLPTEELTGVADGFAVFLEGIDGIVRGLGGMTGIIQLLATVALNAFHSQIGGAIDSVFNKIGNIGKVIGGVVTKTISWGQVGQLITNKFGGIAIAAHNVSSTVDQISSHTGKASESVELFESRWSQVGSYTTKANFDMAQTALHTKDLSTGMEQYNTNLLQVNNVQALIEESSRYLTKEQQEQLSLLQQQALSANEQVMAANNLLEAAERRKAALATSAGDEARDDNRMVEHGKTTTFTSSLNADYMGTIQSMIKEYGAEWGYVDTKVTEVNGKVALVAGNSVDLVENNEKVNHSYIAMKSAAEDIYAISQDDTASKDDKVKRINEIIAKLEQEDKAAAGILKKELGIKGATGITKKNLDSVANGTKRAEAAMRRMARASGDSDTHIKQMDGSVAQVRTEMTGVGTATENFKNKLSQVGTVLNNSIGSALSFGNTISSMAGGFSTVAMGISSVVNAVETLSDDSASFTTKLTAGAMAATMGIGALVTVFKGLKFVIDAASASSLMHAAATDMVTAATGKEVTGLAAKAILKQKNIALNDKEKATKLAEILVSKLGIKTDSEEAKAKAVELLLKGKSIKETQKEIAANYAELTSQLAKNWVLLLVVATIAALIAVIVLLTNAESEEEKQLKRSTASAEKAAERYQELSEKAKAVKDAFSEYDEVVQALNKCKKGTQEWRDALENVQNVVQKIMDEHPEIVTEYVDAFYRDAETGIMMIKEDMADQIVADYEGKSRAASMNNSFAQAALKKDQAAVNYDNAIDNLQFGNSALTDTLKDLTNEQVETLQGLSGSELAEQLAKIKGKSVEDLASDVGMTVDFFTSSLNKAKDPIDELAKASKESSKAMVLASQMMLDQVAPEESAAVKTIAATETVSKEDKYYEAYMGLMTDENQGTYKKTTRKERAQLLGISESTYLTDMNKADGSEDEGYKVILKDLQKYVDSGYKSVDNGVQGADGSRELVFKLSGEDDKRSADDWAKTLASHRAIADANNSITTAKDILGKMDTGIENLRYGKENHKSGEKVNANISSQKNAMNTFIGYGNFDSVSVNDLNELYKAVAGNQGQKDGSISKTDVGWYLDKLFGDGKDGMISDETAKKFNFENAQQMIDSFYNNLQNSKNLIEKEILKFLPTMENIAVASASKIQDAYKKIKLGPQGEKAAEGFVEGLEQMLGNLTGDKRSKALSQLAEIDWSSNDALQQASVIMKEYGITIDVTSDSWNKYAESVRIALNAMPDFSKMKDDLTAINALLNNLSFGSTISDDDYNKLINYNSAWEKYFMLQADGSRKFIGDANAMKEATRDVILSGMKDLAKGQDLANAVFDSGLTMEDIQITSSEAEKAAGGDGKDSKFDLENNTTAQNNLNAAEGYSYKDGKAYKGDKEMESSEANEVLMAIGRGKAAEKLLQNEAVMAALNGKGYEDTTIKEIIEEAKNGNDARLQEMLSGLEDIVGADYEHLRKEYEEMLASTATTFEELDLMKEQYGMSDETYAKATMQMIEAEKLEGLDTTEIAEYASFIQKAADGTGNFSTELQDNAEAANLVAAYTMKMDKGIEKLSNNFGSWAKTLKTGNKESKAYSDAMVDMKDAMSDVLGVSDEFLTDDFILKNMEDIEKAARGDAAAIEALSVAAGKEILMKIAVDKNIDEKSLLDAQKTFLKYMPDLKVGATLEINDNFKTVGQNAVEAAQKIVDGAQMSVSEAQAYFNSLGYEPEFLMQEDTETVMKPVEVTEQTIEKIGEPQDPNEPQKFKVTSQTHVSHYTPVEETFLTPALSADGTPIIKNLRKKTSGKVASPPSSGGGGGGGGSSKKAEKKKKTDVVDRYKEVTDSLEDVAQATEKANKATDGLYGLAKIKNMEKVNSLLKQEIGLYGKKRKEAIANLALDKKAVTDAADAAGVSLTFDADGDISNYTTEMTKLLDQYNEAVDAANADETVSETEQENLDALDEKINNLKDAISQYEETKALLFELDQQEIDKFNEILSNNFEKINAKLELDIEFNEQDLAWIEYQLSKVEDDVYSAAEAMALMWNSTGTGSQYSEYVQNLESYKTNVAELEAAYQNGTISQASYVEGMKAASEGILDNLSSILELDKAMKEYYSNTLSMAQDEISKYTDLMDNAASALEHYTSLMELFGKSTDYTSMGKILEAQAQVSKDAYDSSAAAYKMFNDQALAAKKAYEDALANTSYTGDIDMLKEEWLAAQAVADEAYDEMLSDAEAFAENMRAVLENALAGFAQELENALTGDFGSFDALSTELERASSLQEEFLTTTNKIYETNKMMRTAQKEIDKTTNQMAKRKLKQFINETNALQEQGELSQYELEVQQAKYDLLLAEIALKEAQNAKSTVRLQRDSEGNFGYVYTADQSAIDNAQQKFEDSQNALYNKGLEGANDYAQKYIETMSEMNDTLAEINQQYLDGEFESQKEYEEAIKRAKDYYYKQLENYSNLYQVAIGTDARVTGDSWSKAFGEMTTQTEIWKTKTDEYIGNTQSAFATFDTALKPVKDSLSTSAKSIENITKESKKLRDTLTNSENGVIKALTEELNAVKGVTEAYAAQKKTIDELIASYEGLAQQAGNAAKGAAYDPTAIAPGSGVVLNGVTSWSNAGESADNSETGPDPYNTNYTVLRWDEGKNHVLISDGAGNHGWVPIDKVSAFDTGGYTGSWGSYGKMAMVHEKELILNSNDTENFLASIEFLHKILEIIDLQAMSSQLGGILTSPSLNHNNTNVIEQDVHIEATFPNVVDHNEIEEAFNNLINMSSQYANRK